MPGNGRKVSLYLSEKGSTVTAVSKSALICKGLSNKQEAGDNAKNSISLISTVEKHEGQISNFHFLISASVNAYQFF